MIKQILFVLTILIILGCSEKQRDSKENRVENVLKHFKDSVTDFGIVALVDNGIKKDTASIGFAYKDYPISVQNRFCIGSCTKMFTAVIILKLQEEGYLKIDNSIKNYIPDHPYIDGTITIKHLLNHTSGLTDILKNGFLNEPILNPDGNYSDKVLYSKIDTINFEKSKRYQYCNTNYFLLSKIIEKVTDKSWEMNIQELIIEPLELKNTFPYHSNTIKKLTHPIIDGQDLHEIPKFANNILSMGSGNIVSDVYDMNTFIRTLLIEKTLLSSKSLEQMTNFFEYKKTKTGLGIFKEKYGDRVMLGHTGRQISYISYVFADQKNGESIVVLNNNANDPVIDEVFENLIKNE